MANERPDPLFTYAAAMEVAIEAAAAAADSSFMDLSERTRAGWWREERK